MIFYIPSGHICLFSIKNLFFKVNKRPPLVKMMKFFFREGLLLSEFGNFLNLNCGFQADNLPESSGESPAFPKFFPEFFISISKKFTIFSGKVLTPPPKKKKKKMAVFFFFFFLGGGGQMFLRTYPRYFLSCPNFYFNINCLSGEQKSWLKKVDKN